MYKINKKTARNREYLLRNAIFYGKNTNNRPEKL